MKRVLSLVLAFMLVFSLLPLSAAAAENEALEAEIKRQLDAYADTIGDDSNGGEAINALLDYASEGTGRNLYAGPDHPITAAILNSASFNFGAAKALAAHLPDRSETTYLIGNHSWYTSRNPRCSYRLEGAPEATVSKLYYTGKTNSCDEAMELVTGGAYVHLYAVKKAETAQSTTWTLYVSVTDMFDFDNMKNYTDKNNLGFAEKLLTMLGQLMVSGGAIDPFTWYSYAFTELTIPNELLIPSGEEPDDTDSTTPTFDVRTAVANYAASVTPENALDGTYTDLFTHAYIGQGKDMTIKEGDPIIGSILSSGLFQDAFSRMFAAFEKSDKDNIQIDGRLRYDRLKGSFYVDKSVLTFKSSTQYTNRRADNYYDMVMKLCGYIDFTLTLTAEERNGETIYRADMTFSDRFDKNDEDLKAIITGIGSDAELLNYLTSYNWSGSTSFTLNDYL